MNALPALALAFVLMIQSPTPTATPGQTYKVDIVTPSADTPLFKWYLAFTAIGVVVNAAIFVLILKQTELNRVAADAATTSAGAAVKSAEAAKASSDTLTLSQRPQVAASPHGDSPKECLDSVSPRVQLALHNIGLTTAYDCTWESWIEILPFPFMDFTQAAEYTKKTDRFSLYPKHDPVVINIPIRTRVTEQQREAVRKAKLRVCFRVCVNYRDTFGSDRYANFGFAVEATGLGFLPKYNDSN